MNLIGKRMILEIGEPWDEPYPKREEEIIKTISSKNGKNYLITKDVNSNEIFLLTNRYKGDNIFDIENINDFTVNIMSKLSDEIYSNLNPDDPNIFNKIQMYGIGEIKLKK